jgi:N-acetylglucosaminyl-diphospho-decaprenol L-rhamnosyltransferase
LDLAIVVVSYNTCSLTRGCLQSVYRALEDEQLSARVWVVDNASADGSVDMIREEFQQVTLTALAENLGFARGTNLALSSIDAEGDPPRHVLLLNPDTLVRPGALSQMLGLLDTEPTVGAVGAQLEYGDGSFQHGAFRFPTLWMTFFDFWTINHRLINSRLNGRYPRRLYDAGVPFAIDHPLGAAMMIRWEALRQVGLLDEGYYMYCEEIDWCIRARRAGWDVYCAPQARIVHLAGQSTSQFREQMFVALWRSRYRLFQKYYGRAHNLAVRLIVRAGLEKRARQTRIALSEQRLEPDAAERQLAAYRAVLEM